MALVAPQLGQIALVGRAQILLGAGAFVGARFFRLPLATLFAVGLLTWAGILGLGWA